MDDQKSIENVKKYLKKLMIVIKERASFKFMGKHIVNKNEINNMICCIEGCMPEEFDGRKKVGSRIANMKSMKALSELSFVIKNKSLLNSSSYSIEVGKAEKLVQIINSSIYRDYRTLMDMKYS